MPTSQRLKSAAARLIATTGYPTIVQRLVNTSPVSTHLSIAETARVVSGARLEGDVQIGPGAEVGQGVATRGEIRIAKSARIGPESRLEGTVTVGEGTNLVERAEAIGTVEFGKYNAVARRTTLESRNHEMHQPALQMRMYRDRLDERLDHVSDGPILTGHDVWVGADATVLSGVEIGTGAVVGARSVVTEDVPAYAVVAGVPAEQKGWRFDAETRSQLLELSWWDWSPERMARNAEFFRTDLRTVDDVNSLVG